MPRTVVVGDKKDQQKKFGYGGVSQEKWDAIFKKIEETKDGIVREEIKTLICDALRYLGDFLHTGSGVNSLKMAAQLIDDAIALIDQDSGDSEGE